MEGKEKAIERVNNYLSGKMSPEERTKFEKEIIQNNQLKNILETQSQIQKAILFNRRNEMKAELKDFHKSLYHKQKNIFSNIAWKLAMALLVLSTLAWYVLNKSSFSNEQIFADNYVVYNSTTNLRGGEANSSLARAQSFYESKNYEEASSSFEKLLSSNAGNSEIKLMLGISYFETQKYNDAHRILDQIISVNDPFYFDHALWFKSLMHLKQNENSLAISLLETLTQDPNADHYEAAREILSILK